MQRRCSVLEPGKVGIYGRLNTLWYKEGNPMRYCSGKKYTDNGNLRYDPRCLQCAMCETRAEYDFNQYTKAVLVKAKKPNDIFEDIRSERYLGLSAKVVETINAGGFACREEAIRCLIREFVAANCSLMERFLYTNYYENGYTKKSIRELFGISEYMYTKIEAFLLTSVARFLHMQCC